MPLMGTTFLERLKVNVASLELGLLKFMLHYSLLLLLIAPWSIIDYCRFEHNEPSRTMHPHRARSKKDCLKPFQSSQTATAY